MATVPHILDCSDIDQYLGKPMTEVSLLREPIARNDIRRWVHAMHYPNRLHYDPAFAAESRWGEIIAPQGGVSPMRNALRWAQVDL